MTHSFNVGRILTAELLSCSRAVVPSFFIGVAEVCCRYLVPLQYDTEFVVRTRLKDLRRRTVTFQYQLLSPEEAPFMLKGRRFTF
ncbi:hypothetical protein MYX82_10775 [Acidobacteria bacterium AH-259-D05]|nr:hypothetical protein [Acidobacteria bacterium AH-259-D05]